MAITAGDVRVNAAADYPHDEDFTDSDQPADGRGKDSIRHRERKYNLQKSNNPSCSGMRLSTW